MEGGGGGVEGGRESKGEAGGGGEGGGEGGERVPLGATLTGIRRHFRTQELSRPS